MYQPDIRTIYKNLKGSAKRRGIPFEIQLTDLYELSFPVTCPVLGMPLRFNRGSVADDSFSIDRIDSAKGYTLDNIEVISYRANRLKNNATLDEIHMISQYYKNISNSHDDAI